MITQMGITRNECVIVGGDWSTVLDANIDKAGGVVKKGDTQTLEMKLLIIDIGLIDICQLKNPKTRRLKYEIRKFTCRYCSIKKKDENLEEQILRKRLEELEIALVSVSGDDIDNEYCACKEQFL